MSYHITPSEPLNRSTQSILNPSRLLRLLVTPILALVLSANTLPAQTIGVSNLNTDPFSIYMPANKFRGTAFTTDDSAASFRLNSITIAFPSYPSDVNDFFIQLRAYDGITTPGIVIETLSGGSLPISGTDPYVSTGINKTWNSSGTVLDPNTSYFVIWGFTDGAGYFNAASRNDNVSTGAWSLAHESIVSNDGGNVWNDDTYEAMIQVTATAVPEPSTYAALFSLIAFGFAACKRRRS